MGIFVPLILTFTGDLEIRMSKASRIPSTALAVGAIVFATIAIGQNSSPTDVILERQQGMKDMGAAFKAVRDQLRQASPDMEIIKTAGDNIKKNADLIANWFPRGTGTEAGVKTGAKPEIWSDAGTFDKKRADLVAAAGPFAEVTASGDKAAIGAAVRPLSRTCKGCHDMFFDDEH
jgi:cytochrome c556